MTTDGNESGGLIGPSGWAQRIAAVLGVPPQARGATHMEALVEAKVREAEDLDLKVAPYGSADRDKTVLAAVLPPSPITAAV